MQTSSTDLGYTLALAAQAAPTADNSQPLRFAWNGRTFVIAYHAAQGVKTLFGPSGHATLLAVGAALENVAATLEIWHLPYRIEAIDLEQGKPYFHIHVEASPSGHFQPNLSDFNQRHTNRFPYLQAPIPSEVVKEISGLREGSSRLLVLTEKPRRHALAKLFRQASEARFLTRELHEWLVSSLRFEDGNAQEGLDAATLHLPPGGRLFMRSIRDWRRMAFLNHFGAYKLMAMVDSRLCQGAPALVCILGSQGHLEIVEAGRLMERAWVALNAAGLAVHPYYSLNDQLNRLALGTVPKAMVAQVSRIGLELPTLLDLSEGEILHMMFRVGFPTRHCMRSRRLPLEQAYTASKETLW
ncbi:MAG: hypothetical protein LWX11_03135 [Firmicutes bacterium]|nr:hypothetical protein [Bacillota bacterium]